ncbi:hypothetical protein A2U01_0116377, partial [Trifolium medium]|nr:hypothetical protein [Trifolium medium]
MLPIRLESRQYHISYLKFYFFSLLISIALHNLLCSSQIAL